MVVAPSCHQKNVPPPGKSKCAELGTDEVVFAAVSVHWCCLALRAGAGLVLGRRWPDAWGPGGKGTDIEAAMPLP
eukprot:6183923-Pleurochrysis_carterae.AAC.2